MSMVIRITYPLVLKYEDKVSRLGNLLIQKIFAKYEELDDKNDELKVDDNCTSALQIEGEKISISIGQKSSTIGMSEKLEIDQWKDALQMYTKQLVSCLELESIIGIGFQFKKTYELKNIKSLEFMKKYFYHDHDNSPFTGLVKDIDNLSRLQFRSSFKEEDYTFTFIINSFDNEKNEISVTMQFQLSLKELDINKVLEFEKYKNIFDEKFNNFISKLDIL
ncbi:hypothetical protein [Clostridium magnum]|uniref:Uncharacterized protein n=1 Tax=Clostridium magnum DSM 2767 TaxID=1121326 RepID=A0A161YQS4_9CLOT|nr:hypothetical protein [Clostridium magnum]KZL93252.1 hypothetical protein CLMAG_02750 [Clostridium magnum DSM 2767]SHI19214.1 hypothetical protein SAMN02745944_03070 [Clostridium magnum DSM 2767]